MMINIFYIQKLLLLCALVLHNAKGASCLEDVKPPLAKVTHPHKDDIYNYYIASRGVRPTCYPASLGLNDELLRPYASQGIGLSQEQRRNVEAVCQFDMKKMVLQS